MREHIVQCVILCTTLPLATVIFASMWTQVARIPLWRCFVADCHSGQHGHKRDLMTWFAYWRVAGLPSQQPCETNQTTKRYARLDCLAIWNHIATQNCVIAILYIVYMRTYATTYSIPVYRRQQADNYAIGHTAEKKTWQIALFVLFGILAAWKAEPNRAIVRGLKETRWCSDKQLYAIWRLAA